MLGPSAVGLHAAANAKDFGVGTGAAGRQLMEGFVVHSMHDVGATSSNVAVCAIVINASPAIFFVRSVLPDLFIPTTSPWICRASETSGWRRPRITQAVSMGVSRKGHAVGRFN